MTKAPVPDPAARPLRSDELEGDTPFPDDGPLIDTGPAEIDVERKAAGVDEHESPAPSPLTDLPPD